MIESARLGVALDDGAGEAAVFSSVAEGIELCCLDADGGETVFDGGHGGSAKRPDWRAVEITRGGGAMEGGRRQSGAARRQCGAATRRRAEAPTGGEGLVSRRVACWSST